MNSNFFVNTIKKDLKIALSYRLQFFFSFFSIFLSVAFISIFSRLVDSSDNELLNSYNGGYFVFLFFGFITAEITILLLNTMPNKVRQYQLTGIFEELIMSGQKEINIILYSMGYPVIQLILRILIYLLCFVFISQDLSIISNFSYIGFIAFLLFSISLIGISFISVALTIVYKSPNIINRGYLMLSSVLSGVAFPVEILPKSIVFFGDFLPTTHFLKIFRYDYNDTINIYNELFYNFIALAFLSIFALFFGIYLLRRSIVISKRNGSLLNY